MHDACWIREPAPGLSTLLCLPARSVRESRSPGKSSATFDEVFTLLLAGGLTQDALFDAVVRSHTEIVLTAHPTQVNRRTLQCAPAPCPVALDSARDGCNMLARSVDLICSLCVRGNVC